MISVVVGVLNLIAETAHHRNGNFSEHLYSAVGQVSIYSYSIFDTQVHSIKLAWGSSRPVKQKLFCS